MIKLRALVVAPRRSYYLAHKCQPRPKRQQLTYEESQMHPADRISRPPRLENVSSDGIPLNIGFKVTERKKPAVDRKASSALEEKSRLNELELSMDEMHSEWLKYEVHSDVKNVFRHYGIFTDLFKGAEFTNVAPFDVKFPGGSEIFFGNVIEPSHLQETPKVSLQLETSARFYWSCIMTCPDEHLTEKEGEYIHWAVSNIPAGSSSTEGVGLCPYMPPLPYRGTGFHRYIFVAFFHEAEIDLSEAIPMNPSDLAGRSFSTHDFYQKYQSILTPLSLSFFQSEWDESVTKNFHEVLKLKEPGFEFDAPPFYARPFERFPENKDINYFDRYDPDLYVRYDHDTMREGSWDKLWNTEDYKVAENLKDLDPERLAKVWRKDVYQRICNEKIEYESEISSILRRFGYTFYKGEKKVLPGKLY